MSTISLAASVQIAPVANQSTTAAASPSADAGTTDTKSFADCLKETHDDSDKDHQTGNAPRPQASPNAAAGSNREPHRKTADAASSLTVPTAVTQSQLIDPRGLVLSLQKSAKEQTRSVAAPAVAATTASSSMSATSKAPVAFSVSIPKQSVSAASTTNATAEMNASAAGAHDTRGHSGSKDSGTSSQDSHPDTAAAADSKATQTADATAPVSATLPLQSSSAVSMPMPHAVVDAYTRTSAATAAAPANAAAAVSTVADPPPTTAVRPQSIDIQIPTATGDGVDVRVSQRAGDMQVTVRTPDTDLAQSLRQHLPELSDRLSQTGVGGQIWQPAAAGASDTSMGSGSNYDEPGSNWQGQQGHSQQQQAQTDPDAEQNGRPWADDFRNAEQEGQ